MRLLTPKRRCCTDQRTLYFSFSSGNIWVFGGHVTGRSQGLFPTHLQRPGKSALGTRLAKSKPDITLLWNEYNRYSIMSTKTVRTISQSGSRTDKAQTVFITVAALTYLLKPSYNSYGKRQNCYFLQPMQ